MTNNKLYSLNDIYIGEVYFPITDKTTIENSKIISNGALEVTPKDKNLKLANGEDYFVLLSIFYRYNRNFICLHDGQVYSSKKNINGPRLETVVPITELLPKLGGFIPKRVTLSSLLSIFNNLFKSEYIGNNRVEKMNSDRKYKKSEFFRGTLTLFTGESKESLPEQYKLYNLPNRVILDNNSTFLEEIKVPQSLKEKAGYYEYRRYRCILLSPNGRIYYCLNDFNFYDGVKDSQDYARLRPKVSFVEQIEPLSNKESLNEITVRQALYLSKRMNK